MDVGMAFMANSFKEFGILQMSAIHEMANIGLGHAMRALSDLTQHNFNMSVPSVDSVPVTTLSSLVGGEETLCVATFMPIDGDLEGYTAFVFPWESAQSIWHMLLGAAPDCPENLEEIHQSAMMEIGNILNSSFLNALADMTDLRLHATPPFVGVEMVSSLIGSVVSEAEENDAMLLAVETSIYDEESETKGFFLCIPTRVGLELLFERLGIAEAA